MARKKSLLLISATLIVITLMRPGSSMPQAYAAEISDKLAVLAILGEASGEGYRGMLAVACAIRNRGTLEGVYGVYSAHVVLEPPRVWNMAKRAWKESASKDIVKGAQYWESTDFPRPSWSKKMIITARIGKHIFYKAEKGCLKSQAILAKR